LEPLLTTLIAAGLAEWGDKTQLLVIAFAARYRRPGPILLGVALAALANSLLAAFAGTLIHNMITLRAISLLLALALLSAGAAGLWRAKPRAMGETWKTGPFLTTAACFFLLEFGDKTQLVTAALAAQYNAFALAACGATAGVVAANLPAALLGDALAKAVPLRTIRIVIGCLFLLTGFVVAISALRLA
jgi:putative Ca2+/H+ antiporter (TMEM165/GDT1 family)